MAAIRKKEKCERKKQRWPEGKWTKRQWLLKGMNLKRGLSKEVDFRDIYSFKLEVLYFRKDLLISKIIQFYTFHSI